MIAIDIKSLSKSYGKVNALRSVSFSVEEAEIFGFIGPDGAGKTTLFRIVTTLLLPDAGSVVVLGCDVVKEYKKLRSSLGYMPGRFSLYEDLTVEENINFFASIFGTSLKENYELVGDIYSQIEPFRTRKAGKLSGGMKQKLALSCALIHKPDLLVLDEPTTGVDAVSRSQFWEMLRRLKSKGLTILVSTPYMDEASLCDRVALIQDGLIMDIDTPEKIVSRYEKKIYSLKADDKYRLLTVLRQYRHADTIFPFGDRIHYGDKRQQPDILDLEQFLAGRGIMDADIQEIKPTIEDTFMALMQGKGYEPK